MGAEFIDGLYVAVLDDAIMAKLSLLEIRLIKYDGGYWVATFRDNMHVTGAGLYYKDEDDTFVFGTVEEAIKTACDPERYGFHWGVNR